MDAVQYVYWMQLQQVTLFSLSIHHGISLNPPSRVYVSLEIVTQNFSTTICPLLWSAHLFVRKEKTGLPSLTNFSFQNILGPFQKTSKYCNIALTHNYAVHHPRISRSLWSKFLRWHQTGGMGTNHNTGSSLGIPRVLKPAEMTLGSIQWWIPLIQLSTKTRKNHFYATLHVTQLWWKS